MEVATILTIVVLNILLPTADIVTDINLVVKLYKPTQPGCVEYYLDRDGERVSGIHLDCRRDPVGFCSKKENREHCFYSHYKDLDAYFYSFYSGKMLISSLTSSTINQ